MKWMILCLWKRTDIIFRLILDCTIFSHVMTVMGSRLLSGEISEYLLPLRKGNCRSSVAVEFCAGIKGGKVFEVICPYQETVSEKSNAGNKQTDATFH